jgi:hypothetical protein
VVLGFVVLTVCALAQDLPTGKPESLGLSAERLERTLDREVNVLAYQAIND